MHSQKEGGVPELDSLPEVEEQANSVVRRGVLKSLLTWVIVFMLLVFLCYVGMYLVANMHS